MVEVQPFIDELHMLVRISFSIEDVFADSLSMVSLPNFADEHGYLGLP